MAPRAQLAVPKVGALPHSHRLPANDRDVERTINKLSRQSLIALVLQWLQKKNRPFCRPFLYEDDDHDPEIDDDDAPYEPAHTHEELQELYQDLQNRKGARKEVADRILQGDWRHGISLYQLAMAEVQVLLDHPSSLRWNAKRFVKIDSDRQLADGVEITNESDHLPRISPMTFLVNLVRDVAPLTTAHYYFQRIKQMPIVVLRVFIHDSPYTTEASLKDSSNPANGARSVFFVFPDGSPYVYVSLVTNTGQVVGVESKNLRDVVTKSIPRAVSRPHARYDFQNTNFSARTLSALLTFRGPGKSNAAAGGWSVFVDSSFSQNALDAAIAPRDPETEKQVQENTSGNKGRPKRTLDQSDSNSPEAKRRKEIAEGRFGKSAKEGDGQAIERLNVRIDDPFPPATLDQAIQAVDINKNTSVKTTKRSRKARQQPAGQSTEEGGEGAGGAAAATDNNEEPWTPEVQITFNGPHVFAGIRQLVEQGVIDGEEMPGWMTGEAAVTVGAVKDGRIKAKKGVVAGV